MEQDGQCVYFIDKDRRSVTRVADTLTQPNGIVGSADGKTLYVADIGAKKTYKFTINEDGSLTDQTLFCNLGSDGMTLDSNGNLYLTGKGVTVFDPTGTEIKHIEVPQGWTANVCFGGEDFDTLFITASKGFFSLKMNVTGAAKPN
jgi:gluconolactonase